MAERDKRLNERAWVRNVMERYEKLQESHPLDGLTCIDRPDWAYRAIQPATQLSHSVVVIPYRKWRARELGKFLGRQLGLVAVMWNEVSLGEDVVLQADTYLRAQEKAVGVKVRHIATELRRALSHPMKVWRERFKQFIDEIMLEALHRPRLESSAFLEAFGKANKVSDGDFDKKRIGVNERIGWVMFQYWEPISRFESVGELYRFLAKIAEPMGITITLKRMEKLCSRIGLRYRGRGRPKKKIPSKFLSYA